MPKGENMSFYSIIIPTFNSSDTLKACLESLVLQSYGDFEVIIEDGFSEDNTLELAKAFGDSRIRIFSEPDRGVYDAMNKAVSRALGKWLLFIGSDDTLYSDHVLEEMKVYLDKTDAGMVYGDVKIAGNGPWAKDGEIYRGETPLTTLFVSNICHQAICYSREIFNNRIPYHTDYRVCADYDFNLFCASKYRLEYVPVILSVFNTGGLSSVADDPAFVKEKWVNIVRYFGQRLFDKSFLPYRNTIRQTVFSFLKKGEFRNAILAMRLYLYYKLNK